VGSGKSAVLLQLSVNTGNLKLTLNGIFCIRTYANTVTYRDIQYR